MKVMKFGGSCLQSRAGLARMIELVRPEPRPLVIVLSALKGVTDELIGLMTAAEAGQPFDPAPLRARHLEVLEAAGDAAAKDAVREGLVAHLDELERILTGIAALGEVPARTRDRVLSFGERLSIQLAVAHLVSEGLPAQALVADQAGILTTDEPGDARILGRSEAAVQECFGTKADIIHVVAGFVGRDLHGNITTLGRGGSDTTASDPGVVEAPQILDSVHYLDALEMAHYGLPAIALKALHPARRAGIAIEIRSFLSDEDPTVIGDLPSSHLAISCVPEVVMVDLLTLDEATVVSEHEPIQGGELAEPRPGRVLFPLARFLERLAEAGVVPLLLTEASPAGETTLGIKASDRPAVEGVLAGGDTHLEVVVRDGLAAVSLIGSSMRGKIGFAASVFDCLAKVGVNIESIAQTASERNISVIVAAAQAKTAVRALHGRFVEDAAEG
jgi:aspartokinase